jgi:hypothetical protein
MDNVDKYWLQCVLVELIKYTVNDGLMTPTEKLDYIHNQISNFYDVTEKKVNNDE